MNDDLLKQVLVEQIKNKINVGKFKYWGKWEKYFKFSKAFRFRFIKAGSFMVIVVFALILLFSNGDSKAIKIQKANEVKSGNNLIVEISKLMVLPEEKPSIATIVDYSKLENNLFFKGAKDGDKLLLFKGANRSILYDPETDLILNVGKIEETGITAEDL